MTRRPPFPPADLARSGDDRLYGAPVIAATATVASIGEAAARAVLGRAGRPWGLAVAASLALAGTGAALRLGADPAALPLLDAAGYGWWAGLASGCLAISGMLLLAGVEWRCGIGRAVQTAALLAACIGLLHPAPGSPLAPAALAGAAFALWAVGVVPDLAFLRDRPEMRRAPGRAALTRVAAGGWRGTALHWLVWERACRGLALTGILAAAACQIDLALALAARSGRPDTLLPVALTVGAALSGAGLAAALAAALRRLRGVDGLVTGRHLDILGRLVLALGLAGLYCHVTEMTVSLLYGAGPERAALARRLTGQLTGDAAPVLLTLMLAGLLPTQLLWIGGARRHPGLLGLIGGLAVLGAYAGHVLAELAALAAERPPAASMSAALAALAGSVGLFGLALMLAARLVPAVSVAETRWLALARNRRAAAPVPGATGRPPSPKATAGPKPGLAAAFATEAGLVGALRALNLPEGAGRLDAFGPAPMPEAAAALRREERTLRHGALIGGGVAAAACLAVQGTALAARTPAGWPGVAALDWGRLAVPALSAAALGGILGIGAALAFHARRARPPAEPPPDWRESFVLTLAPETARLDMAAIAQQLAALPEGAGRPAALRRTEP